MRHASIGHFKSALLSFASVLALTAGCGPGVDFEQGISVVVSPSEAMIVPGPDASCWDRTTYLRALASGATDASLSRSVTGNILGYQNFKLVWERQETLYVQAIRVTVSGAGIPNGVYKYTISSTELEGLLARSEGIVEPAPPGGAVVINSSDKTREQGPLPYAACGPRIGEIPLVNEEETYPFSGSIEIELIGMAESSDGTQRFVRARAKARFRYYGS